MGKVHFVRLALLEDKGVGNSRPPREDIDSDLCVFVTHVNHLRLIHDWGPSV